MLVSIVLKLQATRSGVAPAHLGRANYAEMLRVLGHAKAGLDDTLHDLAGMKPMTCSGLLGKVERQHGQAWLRAGEIYRVRVTGLSEVVSAALVKGLLDQRPLTWTLAGHPFAVEEILCDATRDAWSGHTTYEELAEAHLLASHAMPQLQKATLTFESPTAFKSNEMQMPLPLPNLVFGNLIDRWNAFSTVTLNPGMRELCEVAVEVSRFDLASVLMEQKNKALRVGAIGQVTYTALHRDRYWLGLFQMLADFALYSGVGVQTSTGMGQVRRSVDKTLNIV